MTSGSETDGPGAHRQLDRFVESGGTFVDTADVYSNGVSEQIIGRWLGARPAPPGPLTRAGGADHEGPLRAGRVGQRRRAVGAASDPRAGCVAAPAGGGRGR